jgi:hypothetical protein
VVMVFLECKNNFEIGKKKNFISFLFVSILIVSYLEKKTNRLRKSLIDFVQHKNISRNL